MQSEKPLGTSVRIEERLGPNNRLQWIGGHRGFFESFAHYRVCHFSLAQSLAANALSLNVRLYERVRVEEMFFYVSVRCAY